MKVIFCHWKIQYSISFNLRSILSIYGLPKSFMHTHTHLNNIKRGKILYSNKKHWKESLVPNLHRLALKLQLYQGNFLAIKREKATLSLSLSLSPSFLCRYFTTSSLQKRNNFRLYFVKRNHCYVRSLPFQVIKLYCNKVWYSTSPYNW